MRAIGSAFLLAVALCVVSISNAAQLERVWTTALPSAFDSAITDAGVWVAVVGPNMTLYGVNASTGVTMWIGVPLLSECGVYAVPGSADVIAVAATLSSNQYVVLRVDGTTGAVKWSMHPPVVFSGWCLTGMGFRGGAILIQGWNKVFGIEIETGSVRFVVPFYTNNNSQIDGVIMSADAVVAHLEFAGEGVANLAAFSLELNATLWKRAWPLNWTITAGLLGISSSVVLVCRDPNDLVAVGISTGETLWRIPNVTACQQFSSYQATVVDGTAFVIEPGSVSAIDVATGRKWWTRSIFPGETSGFPLSVRVTGGALLATASDVNPDSSYGVARLNWTDGAVLWSNTTVSAFDLNGAYFDGYVIVSAPPVTATSANVALLDAHTGETLAHFSRAVFLGSQGRRFIVQSLSSGETALLRVVP